MKRLLFLVVLLLASFTSYAQPSDSWLTNRMSVGRMPGASMVIINDGHWVFEKNLGKANLSTNTDVSRETVYMMASVSKTMIGTAIMQLWERNLIDLEANVNDYLPFLLSNPNHSSDTITVRMLLTHTSSIRDNWNQMIPLYVNGDSPISLDSFMKGYFVPGGDFYFSNDNFYTYKPGLQHNYSNIATTLAAYLVERVTGDLFSHYCDTAIFQKLCMKNTSFLLAGYTDTTIIARPYSWFSGSYHDNGLYGYPDYPDGQLRTNITGLARFMTMYLQNGVFEGERILDSTTVAYMLQGQTPVDPDQGIIFYRVTSSNGDQLWGHNGGDAGVSTAMYFSLTKKTGVIVLSNGEGTNTSNVDLLADTLYKYGITVVPAATDTFPACQPLTISEPDQIVNIEVYPNPSADYIHIRTGGPSEDQMSIRIIDLQGKTVYSNEMKQNARIDVGAWASGMYEVLIFDSRRSLLKRARLSKL